MTAAAAATANPEKAKQILSQHRDIFSSRNTHKFTTHTHTHTHMFSGKEKKKNKGEEGGGGGRGKSNGKSNQMPTQILFALYIRLTKINTSTDEGSREKTVLARRVRVKLLLRGFSSIRSQRSRGKGGREEGVRLQPGDLCGQNRPHT